MYVQQQMSRWFVLVWLISVNYLCTFSEFLLQRPIFGSCPTLKAKKDNEKESKPKFL